MTSKCFRSSAFELKDLDEKTGQFTGYASVFGNVDSYRDVIEQGAFRKTLDENGHRVKVLWQHDPYTPIGRPLKMLEDDRGLYVEAKVSETSIGKDALILLRDGVINELSIGYSAVKETWDSEAKVRRLPEVKLWEFSPVTWAANDLALIAGVKALDELDPSLLLLGDAMREVKAGRVLSAANRKLVSEALDAIGGTTKALEALLAAADAAGDGKSAPGNQDAGFKSLDTLFKTITAYGGRKGVA
jgi:uncharacterized protein